MLAGSYDFGMKRTWQRTRAPRAARGLRARAPRDAAPEMHRVLQRRHSPL